MYSYMRATVGFSLFPRILYQTSLKDVRCYSCAFNFSPAILSSATAASHFGVLPPCSKVVAPNNLLLQSANTQDFGSSCIVGEKTMDLKDVLGGLEKFAPTSLAESWDNVGLLVEPTPPHQVRTMFLTNDLTEEVLAEAVEEKADFILSYHPPIFSALKRLTMASTKERIIVKAIEKRIAVYSPHTSYDSVAGGVNDWLAEGLGSCEVEPLKMAVAYDRWTHKVEYQEPEWETVGLPADVITSETQKIKLNNGMLYCSMKCNEKGLASFIKVVEGLPEVKKSVVITKLEKQPISGMGTGRMCRMVNAVSIAQLVQLVKNHLKLQHVQLAVGSSKSTDSVVQSVAICAGSGASVLSGVPADVYLTGEMSHHDILAAVAMGTSVIVCNHSNTERGYLPVLKSKLDAVFQGKLNIVVSKVDADPLTVV